MLVHIWEKTLYNQVVEQRKLGLKLEEVFDGRLLNHHVFMHHSLLEEDFKQPEEGECSLLALFRVLIEILYHLVDDLAPHRLEVRVLSMLQ